MMISRGMKGKSSIATSTFITLFIVAMLIISGPAQAVQVMINTDDLNNRPVGRIGSFYVNVTIGANERIPLTKISIEGLPIISGSSDGILVFNVSDLNSVGNYITKGNYNISLIDRHGWVGGYGYGYGYNNNDENAPYYGYGYGYPFYGYGYGYGHGYGYGYGYGHENPNTYTELKYKVTIDTTGAVPGTYSVKVEVSTGQKAVFQGSSSFTLTASSLVLWNKLGSDYEVLNSAYGPDLEFYAGGGSSPDGIANRKYVPGVFGNGVTIDAGTYSSTQRIRNIVLNNLTKYISLEKGAIESWYIQREKPEPYDHNPYRIFDGPYGLDSGLGFYVYNAPDEPFSPQGLILLLGSRDIPRYITYSVNNIPNNQWIHLAAVWDRSGIDGTSETMRIYIDGNKVASSTYTDWGTTVGYWADIGGGNDQNIADKFAIDNLKIWNYAKTNFSDRFEEGDTTPPVVPVLTTITVSPSTATLNVNGTQILNASAKYQNGTPMAGINISWTSSNMTVGNLTPSNSITDANGNASTTFTALVPGTATINAANGTVAGNASVTATAATTSSSLVLWNKLDSDDEVQNSEIGPDGVIIGNISYFPAKFGNGFKPQERADDNDIPNNFIKYENLNLGQKGSIEFWYQPDWDDWRVGHVVDLLMYGKPDSRQVIAIQYNDWQDKLNMEIWNNGSYEAIGKYIIPSQTPGWSTVEPFHIALTWDGTESNPVQRVKIFINGNETGTYGAIGNPTFDDWGSDFVLYLGSRMNSGDWDRHNWEGADGVIDNIKIWNYPKTDFSDRFEEGDTTPPTAARGSISGYKINDINGNGNKDADEPGLADWNIKLENSNGSVFTTTTNASDFYIFTDLAPDNYTVSEVPVPGWIQTFPAAPGIYNLALAVGENVTGMDFGNNLRSLPSGVNATREIEKESLLGNSTNITVSISSNMTQALALQETIPLGWNLTRISDDADGFKDSTNEWVWSNVTPGITKTVIYRITAPATASIGTYYINGTVSNSSGVIAIVGGDNIITLDILTYYRRLGSDPAMVETTDLLKAMDDWRSGTAPVGFARPITGQELLTLINEWAEGV